MKPLCVMLVATEASGDALGAALIAALRHRLGQDTRFVGVGGYAMAQQGVHSPFDTAPLAVLGVFNALAIYPLVLRRVGQTGRLAKREKPDLAILIDAWGFNLRVARRLRRIDPKLLLIKYVAPQVWATRPGRARTLAGAVNHLLTIHAFDAHRFEKQGLPVTFVGNPAAAGDFSAADPRGLRARIGAGPTDPLLLLLPGSRIGEIDRLLPSFEAAATRLKTDRPRLAVVVAPAPTVARTVRARVSAWPIEAHVLENEADRRDAMRAATVALACSGTVTTQLALAGCPMVVAYRLGPLTHMVAKRLIRTRYITLVNVAADAFVAPEFVQNACSGQALADELGDILDNPVRRARQIAAQDAAIEAMRGDIDDPVAAAADAVVELARRWGRLEPDGAVVDEPD